MKQISSTFTSSELFCILYSSRGLLGGILIFWFTTGSDQSSTCNGTRHTMRHRFETSCEQKNKKIKAHCRIHSLFFLWTGSVSSLIGCLSRCKNAVPHYQIPRISIWWKKSALNYTLGLKNLKIFSLTDPKPSIFIRS